jgi:hypothetical protein
MKRGLKIAAARLCWRAAALLDHWGNALFIAAR